MENNTQHVPSAPEAPQGLAAAGPTAGPPPASTTPHQGGVRPPLPYAVAGPSFQQPPQSWGQYPQFGPQFPPNFGPWWYQSHAPASQAFLSSPGPSTSYAGPSAWQSMWTPPSPCSDPHGRFDAPSCSSGHVETPARRAPGRPKGAKNKTKRSRDEEEEPLVAGRTDEENGPQGPHLPDKETRDSDIPRDDADCCANCALYVGHFVVNPCGHYGFCHKRLQAEKNAAKAAKRPEVCLCCRAVPTNYIRGFLVNVLGNDNSDEDLFCSHSFLPALQAATVIFPG